MISLFNAIIRRGHVPREVPIQNLMSALGLVVTPNADANEDESVASGEISESEIEQAESSVATHDEAVAPGYLSEHPAKQPHDIEYTIAVNHIPAQVMKSLGKLASTERLKIILRTVAVGAYLLSLDLGMIIC